MLVGTDALHSGHRIAPGGMFPRGATDLSHDGRYGAAQSIALERLSLARSRPCSTLLSQQNPDSPRRSPYLDQHDLRRVLSYTAVVERYLTGVGIAKSSARIHRISLTTCRVDAQTVLLVSTLLITLV
ncbi:hypothetical protein [Streptomyces sp. NPDC093099]|uniref:hypothetical protein n=1 Tax=Streptomyces sp. NPDC093099 TaxID=3366028 RepID=UPI0038013184